MNAEENIVPIPEEESGGIPGADTAESAELPVSNLDPDSVASGDGRSWYVIHTYSGYENKVKKNLEHRIITLDMADRIFRVEVPTVEEIEIKAGQRHPVQRKIFPGYVLVEMVMDDESWHVVRNTPGITGFVGTDEAPTPMPDGEISSILQQMTASPPARPKKLGGSHRTVKVRILNIGGDPAQLLGQDREVGPTRCWYVLSVKVGQETNVKQSLEQRIEKFDLQETVFRVEIPSVNGEPFGGFILVQMLEDHRALVIIRNTPGVNRCEKLDL